MFFVLLSVFFFSVFCFFFLTSIIQTARSNGQVSALPVVYFEKMSGGVGARDCELAAAEMGSLSSARRIQFMMVER